MARPIWTGSISFGLIHIPVSLYSAENQSDQLHFHLLDSRDKSRIRYERINESTGKEVPWDKIIKVYEFEKGHYVEVDEKELEKIAYESQATVEIEDFIDKNALEAIYFEKPYYLIPGKQGAKGYHLLYETLIQSKKIGIAKVVIRTRQYLAAMLPFQDKLMLMLLRYPQEIKKSADLEMPKEAFKISKKEIEMAERLVKSMTSKWNPKKYHDKNREMLSHWIENKIKTGKFIDKSIAKEKSKSKVKSAKIFDFMTLLEKSIKEKENKGTLKNKDKKKSTNKTITKIKNKPKTISKPHKKNQKTQKK